jgi:hypothetical protein
VKQNNNNNKSSPNEPGLSPETLFSFLFFYLFTSFILLIQFNFVRVLTFLKDARERGAHDNCQSPLPGQVGPGPGLTV